MDNLDLKNAIVILGKEPIPGKVKTRLAKDIGKDSAAKIQAVLAKYIFTVLQEGEYPVILQLQGDLTGPFAKQCRTLGVIVEPQHSGTLTEKIYHASKRAKRTLILGMDMPLLNLNELRLAIHSPNIVLGPAKDGGYWLIGGSQLPKEILEDIPWSTENVWETTLARCEELKIPYDVLSCQQDIDTISDLQQLLSNPQCPTVLRLQLQDILDRKPHHL